MRVIVAAMLIAGCSSSEEASQSVKADKAADMLASELRAVRQSAAMSLRDPDSAKFRNVRRYNMVRDSTTVEIPVYCGEINGKNAFGAYAGFQKFAVLAETAKKGDSADIWDESQPGSAMGYLLHCQDDGKERTDGTPVSLDKPR